MVISNDFTIVWGDIGTVEVSSNSSKTTTFSPSITIHGYTFAMGRGAINRAYYRVAKDGTWEFEIYNPTGSKATITHCRYFILGY